MNIQLAKNIRQYVDIKLQDEGLPKSQAKRLYKAFKATYEKATPQVQAEYRQEMEQRILQERKLQNRS